MKKISLWCAVFAIFAPINGCTIKNITNVKQDFHKIAKKRVEIPWESKESIKEIMNEAKKPIFVLFAKPKDQQSDKSFEIIQDLALVEKISFLNMDEAWVSATFYQMQLTEVPTLLILDPINEDGSKEMIGYSAIRTYLRGTQ